DDFLNKPYEVSELVARIFSLLRRSKLSSKNIIRYNELQIDLLAKSVLVNEVLLGLTKKEFELLLFFLEHKNKVVTKDALLTYLSGQLEDSKSNADIIYAHIKNLKRKMNDAGCKIYLNTIYGIGYKWED
ncbi:response regulator transcription factor, partial [Arcicella lustrica]